MEFKLPELGENIKGGDVVKINVSPGEKVRKDQALIEIETDKAVIEVPSDFDGVVREVRVKVGDKVRIGQAVMTIDGGNGEAEPTATPAPAPADKSEIKPEAKSRESAPTPTAQPAAPAKAPPAVSEPPSPESGTVPEAALRADLSPALAAPSVRKLAREIGIDVDTVVGTGPQGRVTIEDVKATARRASTDNAGFAAPRGSGVPALDLPDFAKFGALERKPMTSVRRKTAERMAYAWQTIPHVTQHDDADITELENLRKQFGKRAEAAGGNLTVTVIVLKIVAAALKVFPQFNASLDMTSQEIIYKKYTHVGVAVDTDRGLIVPVIRDVDKKNIIKLSAELTEAAEKARNKKTTLEEMQGGSFTITNLGGIGGAYFTPIINPPEVAILGLGRWRYQQIYSDGKFEARKMLPLSLSYDHRLIDGADAARFLRWVADAVKEPFLMDLEG